MSTDPLNTNPEFVSSDGKGFVRSVSLIFMVPEQGYLLCSEMRKSFPNPSIRTHEDHMIGGKVDETDRSCLECGFREFCEETGYRVTITDNHNTISNGKELSIAESVITMISKFNECSSVKWDFCVSPKKGLYNRFYVVKVDNCRDYEFLSDFLMYVSMWEKKEKDGEILPLESLFFWQPNDDFDHIPTSLLSTFVKNLPY